MFVHTVIMVIEPHMKQGRQHKLISTIFLATSVTKKLDHNKRKLDPEIWCFLRELMHLQGRSAMWGFMLEALGCCIVVRLLAMRTLLLLTGTAICMLLEGWQLFRNEAAKNEICADLPGQFMDM